MTLNSRWLGVLEFSRERANSMTMNDKGNALDWHTQFGLGRLVMTVSTLERLHTLELLSPQDCLPQQSQC